LVEIEFNCLPSSQIKVFTTFSTLPRGTIITNNKVARNKSTENDSNPDWRDVPSTKASGS